jgi:hypothetical protein
MAEALLYIKPIEKEISQRQPERRKQQGLDEGRINRGD